MRCVPVGASRRLRWGCLGLAAIVAGIAGSSLYGQTETFPLHPAKPGQVADKPSIIGGYTLTLALAWEMDKLRLDAGVRGFGGRPESAYGLLPERGILFVGAALAF